jgi:hypothetical protein
MAIANVNADTMNIQVVSSSSILTLTVTAYGNETIYTKDYSANERSAKISDIKLTSSQKTALQVSTLLLLTFVDTKRPIPLLNTRCIQKHTIYSSRTICFFYRLGAK